MECYPPWLTGQASTVLPVTDFFLLLNSICAYKMITLAFAPISNGLCGPFEKMMLILLPICFSINLLPGFLGGIIPAVIYIALPYGIGTCIGFCCCIWGCQYGMKEATADELEKAEDKEGNKI